MQAAPAQIIGYHHITLMDKVKNANSKEQKNKELLKGAADKKATPPYPESNGIQGSRSILKPYKILRSFLQNKL